MAFSSGLRVPTMSTHQAKTSGQRKQNREKWRMKPKLPKLHCSFPFKGCENEGEEVKSPSLIPQLQVSPVNTTPPRSDAGRDKKTRRVPLKEAIGHWSCKFNVATQTDSSDAQKKPS